MVVTNYTIKPPNDIMHKKLILTYFGNFYEDYMRIFGSLICLITLVFCISTVHAEELPKMRQVNTALTDAYITAKIETAILQAKLFDDESIPLVGINASTNDGVVTITGHVAKQTSIDLIISRIEQVNGVKKIISNLTIIDPKEKTILDK
jgi:hyperosmotically inducible periplasmic protein